jgi:hypothetical protein
MPIGLIQCAITVPASTPLPAGVTLQPIDGEVMLFPTTMSHNYFTNLGATLATSTAFGAKSWDDPTFFPHCSFYGLYPAGVSSYLDIGLNCSIDITGGTDLTVLTTNKVWGSSETKGYAAGTAENDQAGQPGPLNAAVCALTLDEDDPQNYIGLWSPDETGRFWIVDGTWNCSVFGDIGNVIMRDVLARGQYIGSKSIGLFAIDVYWMAGSGIDGTAPPNGNIQGQGAAFANGQGSTQWTVDQMSRGSNYGNMIDQMRSWGNGTNASYGYQAAGLSGAASAVPFLALIETGDGHFDESTRRSILAKEWNWAVWSSIIHGARGIDSFSSIQEFTTSIRTGDTVSMYNQAKATIALINSIVTVITSPFAKGYLTAVSPHGYIFPVYESNWQNGGIEACVKWDGSNFYIFATTRNSQTAGSTSATFTINSNASASTATVLNESRSIPIVGHTFSDTFTNPWDVHLYKIS